MVDYRAILATPGMPMLLIGVGAGLLARSVWRQPEGEVLSKHIESAPIDRSPLTLEEDIPHGPH